MKMRLAYTLTELLVATAVGSIVMAMAFSSFSIINQKYQKYSSNQKTSLIKKAYTSIVNKQERTNFCDLHIISLSAAEILTELHLDHHSIIATILYPFIINNVISVNKFSDFGTTES